MRSKVEIIKYVKSNDTILIKGKDIVLEFKGSDREILIEALRLCMKVREIHLKERVH